MTMADSSDRLGTSERRGWAYVIAVVLLSAPTFVPYALAATSAYQRSEHLLVLDLLFELASPFTATAALVVGVVGLCRSRSTFVRTVIVILLLVTLKVAYDLFFEPRF
jgi:hypothetical protein